MPTITTDPWPEPPLPIPAKNADDVAKFADIRTALDLIVGTGCLHDWRRLPLTKFSFYVSCETCFRVVDLGGWDRTPRSLALQRWWQSLAPLTGPRPDPYGATS